MLLILSGLAPLHLAEELHALLPTSAQHHAQLHCEDNSCDEPKDDVSQPLSGEQHETHHASLCDNDSEFSFLSNGQELNVAPSQWDLITLDFATVPQAPRLEIPAFPKKSRAPPGRDALPSSLTYSLQSGRAPPFEI